MKALLLIALLATILPLRAQFDPNSDKPLPTDDPKAVALYQACTKEDLAEVKNLIGSGAPVDGKVGKYQFTPLMEAIEKSNMEILQVLIDYRANVDLPDIQGSTPLLHACNDNNAKAALALIKAGANVNLGSTGYGRTPLMYASQKGNDQIVQALIEHKVDLNALCSQGPALRWAVNNKAMAVIKLLVAAGADPNLMPPQPDKGLFNTLGCAAANDDLETMDLLLGQKADVNGTGEGGVTPLMAAAEYNSGEALERLLAAGANVGAKDKRGRTALMIAAGFGEGKIVRTLLDKGADPNDADPLGNTALNMAGVKGDTDVVDMLKAAGAKLTDVHIIPKPQALDPLPPPPAWALAVGAIYTLRDGNDTLVLGGGESALQSKRMLKGSWNVTDKGTLISQLDDLRDRGHHSFYQSEGAQFARMNDTQFAAYLAEHADRKAAATAMRASYQKWGDKSGLAWDLVRSANVINAGFSAKYLTAREAWDRLIPLARTAQGSFASWQEMSDNFLDGREIWAGKRDPRFEACSKVLLNPKDANSPWNLNPWKTDLSGNW